MLTTLYLREGLCTAYPHLLSAGSISQGNTNWISVLYLQYVYYLPHVFGLWVVTLMVVAARPHPKRMPARPGRVGKRAPVVKREQADKRVPVE